jgi:hypothetical protein
VIWVASALFVGLVIAGPAVFVLIKPSLAPFAVVGIRHRRWWGLLLVFVLASVPFGALWRDWATALVNSNASLFYSAREALMLAIPVVAWAARDRPRSMQPQPADGVRGAARSAEPATDAT